eukprot:841068-Alexandrium_andersonii.AAC.1
MWTGVGEMRGKRAVPEVAGAGMCACAISPLQPARVRRVLARMPSLTARRLGGVLKGGRPRLMMAPLAPW